MMVDFTEEEYWIIFVLLEKHIEYGDNVGRIKKVIKILDKIEDEVFTDGENTKTK